MKVVSPDSSAKSILKIVQTGKVGHIVWLLEHFYSAVISLHPTNFLFFIFENVC